MIFDSYDDTGFECRVSEIVGLEMHGLVTLAEVGTVIASQSRGGNEALLPMVIWTRPPSDG